MLTAGVVIGFFSFKLQYNVRDLNSRALANMLLQGLGLSNYDTGENSLKAYSSLKCE